jgi:hypothetical protein
MRSDPRLQEALPRMMALVDSLNRVIFAARLLWASSPDDSMLNTKP